MSIRDHNYNEIIEHTKRSFNNFSKRYLAKQIIQVLQRNKIKKEAIVSQSDINVQIDQVQTEGFGDKKNYFEDNQSISKNTSHLNKQAVVNVNSKHHRVIKIQQLSYGDYVIIDAEIAKQQWRIYSNLQGLKLLKIKQVTPNVFYLRKSCFQIVPPTFYFQDKDKKINSNSMICLKNIFTGNYIHLTSEISKTLQFGYELKLRPQISKSALFKFVQNENLVSPIRTDQYLVISSYYRPDINVSMSEQNLLGKVDRSLIGSYSELEFKLSKIQNTKNLNSNPYFYIHCVEIDKNLEVQELALQKFTVKKQIREFEIEQAVNNDKSCINNQNQIDYRKCQFFQLTSIRPSNSFRIRDWKNLNLCQIWQIQKVCQKQQVLQCRIRNVISNQQLASECKQNSQNMSTSKRNSVLQFKRQQKNHYIIMNDQNISLTAVYNNQTENYVLKYEQVMNLNNQNESLMSKTYSYRFELIQLEMSHSNIICQLLEVQDVLKDNYMLLLKWGFHYQDRTDKIKYSLIDLKKDIRLMRKKIKQINSALSKLALMLKKQENNLNNIQNICKQLKILEILIIYCQIIKIKIGKPSEFIVRAIYTFASNQLKQTLFKLFQIIFLLAYHNKRCSQIIIEHNVIFNQLLKDYSEQIGCIIQEAIKNLCILTNKIVEQEDLIFSWTTHIQQITDPQLFQIQKQYIDIISEVVVDPNDIGIHPYQYKIKQQLIGNRKKKILPKFGLSAQKNLGTHEPLIIFQYDSFPVETSLKEINSKILTTTFQLKHLFHNRKNKLKFIDQIAYIGSILKLMRNLCKDRNKKLSRVMEDYGLTIQFMHSVFKNKQISWQIITKFLDLYCVMYTVQDPFLSFEKREVKCYSWQKISNFDFNLKTGKLFNQFTEQVSTLDKQRDFDIYILPIFDNFFEDFKMIQEGALDRSKIQSFYNIISIIYEVVNYGYLSHKSIQIYIKYILKFSELVLRKETKSQEKQKIIMKVVQLFSLAQQIWTIIQSMNLLLIVYKNLKSSNTTSNEYLTGIFTKALDYDQSILQQKSASTSKKRKASVNMKSSGRDGYFHLSQKIVIDHHHLDLQIVQFTLKKIVQNRLAINSKSLQYLLKFLQTINDRGQRMCEYLRQIFILNNSEAEKLYIQYSGIAPLQSSEANASRRLLNVMKVKELVDKITQQNVESQDETRKKEKILQLKNLLIKIINNLDQFKKYNNQLFIVCQTLLKKLRIHSLLIQVMKFYDKQNFQSLINQIILFFIQFIRGNQDNLMVIAQYFPLFTKKYSYQKLPELLLSLFKKITNKQECFWMIYRNIDKKMEDNHKQILFQCIYNIIKICPATLLDNIKGQVIYSMITNSKFEDYIKGTNQSPNFINIICFIGNGSIKLPQRIKQSITKTQLLESLMSKSTSYILKSMHLKLYHFLYISSQSQIDQVQCEQLISKVFLTELKHLPSSCHYRASQKLQSLRSSENKQKNSKQYDGLESFISQFRNLLMEGGERIETSVEEQYFLFLLNIQNENQLCLLTCLHQILLKFKITNIQPLSSYIFKIISSMETLFVKEQQVYQSRILNKLYEISTVIQEKYNRTHRRSSAYQFQMAYSKVQVFFKKFATIIQQQNISYFKLLKCAQIQYSDLQIFRNHQKKQKLIIQSEFLKFMSDLVQIMNNKSQFSKLTQQGIIKQFFMLYSQKNTHKLNIIKFISKLMEVLQYQKSANLYNHLMESKKSEQYKDIKTQEKTELQVINCQLLQRQLSQLGEVFSLHLKHFMSHKIKSKLQSLLQQADYQTFPEFLRLSSHNILQIHSKNSQFSINNLIIFQILEKFNCYKPFELLDSKVWQNYFQFVNSLILTKTNPYIIKILYKIYDNVKENEYLLNTYIAYFEIVLNTCFQLIKLQISIQSSIIFSLYGQLYNIIYKITKNSLISTQTLSNIEILLSNKLIQIFENYSKKPDIYWGKHCHSILAMILASFINYKNIAKVLSNSNLFINCLRQLLVKILNNGIVNTNTECQEMIKIINEILRLLKKFCSKSLITQLAKIIVNWPFKTILKIFEENYLCIYEKKYQKAIQCQRNFICSEQFCNYDKLTEYDRFILEILINMLIIVHIGSDILMSKEQIKQLDNDNKQSLVNYHQYLQGKAYKNNTHLGIMRTIPVIIDEQCTKICFMLPFNDKFRSIQLQQQIQQQLSSVNKDHYFQNIYHLSLYIQSQYEDIKRINNSHISKHIVSNSQILQFAFIAYLFIICIVKIFTKFNIPSSILYTINSIIIFSKLVLLAIQGKKLYTHHRLLKEIKYDKKVKKWKYFQILLSVLSIISYFLQYFSEQFYALTFTIQILKIRSVGNIMLMILQVTKSLFYIVLFFQSIILTCTFQIFEKKIKSDDKMSLIDIYFGLGKEIVFLQFMPLLQDDNTYYKLMRLAPQFLPMYTFSIYFLQSVVVAFIVIRLLSFNTKMKEKHERCGICGLSKEYLQSTGKKYEIHIKYEHSTWNYIQFFIYIRNKNDKEIEEIILFELIQKQDFRFLKVQ